MGKTRQEHMKNNNNGDRNIWKNRRRYHMRKKNRNDRNIWKNTAGTSEIIIIVTGTYEKNKRRQKLMKKIMIMATGTYENIFLYLTRVISLSGHLPGSIFSRDGDMASTQNLLISFKPIIYKLNYSHVIRTFIHPRASYSPRALPSGNMLLLGE